MIDARVYVSIGSPLHVRATSDGWAGPDLEDPTDPDHDVYFDVVGLTYAHGRVPLAVHTSQVDMFGLPPTVRLQQPSSGYDSTVGIALRRADVYARFTEMVAAPFRGLAGPHRIVAPFHGEFRPGRSQPRYLDDVIDHAWARYASQGLSFTAGGDTYRGAIVDGRLHVTGGAAPPRVVDKPTIHDVMAGTGALGHGDAVAAQLAAAFHRGVALTPSAWDEPDAYFQAFPRNDYAWFFHQISLQGRAYGFAHDDVHDQSSLRRLANADPPSSVTIGVGW